MWLYQLGDRLKQGSERWPNSCGSGINGDACQWDISLLVISHHSSVFMWKLGSRGKGGICKGSWGLNWEAPALLLPPYSVDHSGCQVQPRSNRVESKTYLFMGGPAASHGGGHECKQVQFLGTLVMPPLGGFSFKVMRQRLKGLQIMNIDYWPRRWGCRWFLWVFAIAMFM